MNHTEVKQEMDRRKSTRQRMLEAFKDKGELTTYELISFGPGFSTRLHELRDDGHVIPKPTLIRPGCYKYVYKGQKDEDGEWLTQQNYDEPFILPYNRKSFLGLFRKETQK